MGRPLSSHLLFFFSLEVPVKSLVAQLLQDQPKGWWNMTKIMAEWTPHSVVLMPFDGMFPLPERKLSVKGIAAGGGQEPEQAARRPRRLSASISSQDQLRPQDAAELRGAGEE